MNIKHSVKYRIVSISQPHFRPIAGGKANAKVEFGVKVGISIIDGYAFVDKISWNAYSESSDLIPVIEKYRQRYRLYPEAVMVDKLYRNKGNIKCCRFKGIRISVPKLGCPRKDRAIDKEQGYSDSGIRNAVGGKFALVRLHTGRIG